MHISKQARLFSIANRIREAEKYAYAELFSACDDLYKALLQFSEIDSGESRNRQDIMLEDGKAVGVTWAAMCIKDIMRTKRFMDGIYEATCDKMRSAAGRPVHILYVGTGPFALLVLPLIARFSSLQVQFTFLEINPYAINFLQKLFTDLRIEQYINKLECTDAAKWAIGPEDQFDIFVCETMQRSLVKEPQVAVCMNILPQLSPGAVMIPCNVSLTAAFIHHGARMKEKMGLAEPGNSIQSLGKIFDFNRETILEHAGAYRESGNGPYHFPVKILEIESHNTNGHDELYALTNIEIYKGHKLLLDESELTMPLKLTEFMPGLPLELKLQYQTGSNPGLKLIS